MQLALSIVEVSSLLSSNGGTVPFEIEITLLSWPNIRYHYKGEIARGCDITSYRTLLISYLTTYARRTL